MAFKGVMKMISLVADALRFIGRRFCFAEGHYSPLFLGRSGGLRVIELAKLPGKNAPRDDGHGWPSGMNSMTYRSLVYSST